LLFCIEVNPNLSSIIPHRILVLNVECDIVVDVVILEVINGVIKAQFTFAIVSSTLLSLNCLYVAQCFGFF
jgi:hypothetical protein